VSRVIFDAATIILQILSKLVSSKKGKQIRKFVLNVYNFLKPRARARVKWTSARTLQKTSVGTEAKYVGGK
jgi:hypothetical protein